MGTIIFHLKCCVVQYSWLCCALRCCACFHSTCSASAVLSCPASAVLSCSASAVLSCSASPTTECYATPALPPWCYASLSMQYSFDIIETYTTTKCHNI